MVVTETNTDFVKRSERDMKAGRTIRNRTKSRLLAAVDALATGQPINDADIRSILGANRNLGRLTGFLERLLLLPWLTIDRTIDGR